MEIDVNVQRTSVWVSACGGCRSGGGALKIGPEDGPGEPFWELCPQSSLRAQTPSAAALSCRWVGLGRRRVGHTLAL